MREGVQFGRVCEGNHIQASPEHLKNHIINVNAAISSFFIQGQLFNLPTSFLIDTESPVSLLQSAVWNQTRPPETALNSWGGNKIVGVNGTVCTFRGQLMSPSQ